MKALGATVRAIRAVIVFLIRVVLHLPSQARPEASTNDVSGDVGEKNA